MGRGGTRGLLLSMFPLILLLLAFPVQAAAPSVSLSATIDGHALAAAGANSPIPLRPADDVVVRVEVINNTSSPLDVRSVRFQSRVLGLAFFSYITRVDLRLGPGESGTRTFALDLSDLDGQATGLLPAEVALVAPDRSVLAVQKSTVDVRGKLLSVYGVFGLTVAAITALLLLVLIVRMVRRSLPPSRWTRALRFAIPGVGLGLTVTFTLGVVRVLVPSLGTSLVMLAGGLVLGFVLGYLTPNPADEADRDELDERDILTQEPPEPPAGRDSGSYVDPFPIVHPDGHTDTEPNHDPLTYVDPRQTRVGEPPAQRPA